MNAEKIRLKATLARVTKLEGVKLFYTAIQFQEDLSEYEATPVRHLIPTSSQFPFKELKEGDAYIFVTAKLGTVWYLLSATNTANGKAIYDNLLLSYVGNIREGKVEQ